MNILTHLRDIFVPHADNNYTPHVLGHRPLSLYAGLMISVKLLSLFSIGLLPANQAFSSAVTPVNILELTNQSRKAYSLSELQMNSALTLAAQKKAADMVKYQYFSHNSPGGKTPWDFIKGQGYNYIIAGENLAINFYDSQALENAWMNSPGHKANILNRDFQDIGIGVVQGEYKGVKAIFVVQLFGTSVDQQIETLTAYNSPVQLVSIPEVNVPVPSKIALAAPSIAEQKFSLTNKDTYQLGGYAPNAEFVYVVVNDKPQTRLDVIDGKYNGEIMLSEGNNKINTLSFNTQNEASPISQSITVKLDSVAPAVVASIRQTNGSEGKAYIIEAQVPGNVTKVIATVGDQKVMLQPSSDPLVWNAKIFADSPQLQGGINVRSYDLAGNSRVNVVGSFSDSVVSSFGFLAQKDMQISFLGKFVPLNAVNNMYMYFIVFLLSALCLAIVFKNNIQPLGMITHTSAMVIVALILWAT
ncbi:MAG: hypothetical protein NVS3B9_6410 [Candidatus Doudnabacteria bacterium]